MYMHIKKSVILSKMNGIQLLVNFAPRIQTHLWLNNYGFGRHKDMHKVRNNDICFEQSRSYETLFSSEHHHSSSKLQMTWDFQR